MIFESCISLCSPVSHLTHTFGDLFLAEGWVLAGQIPYVSSIAVSLFDKTWREPKFLPVDSLLWVKALVKFQRDISSTINQVAYQCHLNTYLNRLSWRIQDP